MTRLESEIEGTLKPDGTLELDQRPSLPPGRVRVLLRQEAESATPSTETWWECIQRLRRELEDSGSRFMNDEEVTAHIEWLREDDRIDAMLRTLDSKG